MSNIGYEPVEERTLGPTPSLSHAKPAMTDPSLSEMLSLTDWGRFVPETLLIYVSIWILQFVLVRSLLSPEGIPQLYWIPVLLVSCQYGVMGGLFATLVAICLLLANGLPQQSATQDFYAYAGALAVRPAEWLGSALVLGGIRNLHLSNTRELETELGETTVLAEQISQALQKSLQQIAALEKSIAVEGSTVAALSHSIARLDLRDSNAAVESYADIIRIGINADRITMYFRKGSEFFPVYCFDARDNTPVPIHDKLSLEQLHAFRISDTKKLESEERNSDPTERQHVVLLDGLNKAIPMGAVICSCIARADDQLLRRQRLYGYCRGLENIIARIGYPVPGAGVGCKT